MVKVVSKILITTTLIFTFFANNLFSENVSEDYVKFVTGSVSDKTAVLLHLSITEETDSLVATLPEKALDFVAENVPVIGNVEGMKELTAAAIPLVKLDEQDDFDLLWNMFKLFPDDIIRTAILSSFSEVVQNNRQFVYCYLPDIHTFIAENIASASYSSPACLQAVKLLGKIADLTSFELLFRIVYQNHDVHLTETAVKALEGILPISQAYLSKFITKESVSIAEKNLLFSLIQENKNIPSFFKADIAENALSTTIITVEDVSKISSSAIELQLATIKEIKDLSWTRASSTVAKFFPLAQKEFEVGLITESDFLEIISCLQTLATTHSVAVLLDYLGTLNSLMAVSSETFNESVILTVINALGALGDKSSFDNLLYVTYLPYPETVVTAARNALAGLKW